MENGTQSGRERRGGGRIGTEGVRKVWGCGERYTEWQKRCGDGRKCTGMAEKVEKARRVGAFGGCVAYDGSERLPTEFSFEKKCVMRLRGVRAWEE